MCNTSNTVQEDPLCSNDLVILRAAKDPVIAREALPTRRPNPLAHSRGQMRGAQANSLAVFRIRN